MPLSPGDPLPDLPLVDTAGASVSLAGFRGEHTLLIFLRHLAWLPCREHLVEVLDAVDRLRVRVAIVSFAEPKALQAYETGFGIEGARLYSDTSRAAYAAFGFDRASVARVWLDPRVWLRYAVLLARGRRPAAPEEDTLQLGGDVLVDAGGRVRWIHRSVGPADRPSVDRILAARDAPGA